VCEMYSWNSIKRDQIPLPNALWTVSLSSNLDKWIWSRLIEFQEYISHTKISILNSIAYDINFFCIVIIFALQGKRSSHGGHLILFFNCPSCQRDKINYNYHLRIPRLEHFTLYLSKTYLIYLPSISYLINCRIYSLAYTEVVYTKFYDCYSSPWGLLKNLIGVKYKA